MGRIERIQDTLSKRPYHQWIRDDLYKISQRIREIDDGYFILQHIPSGSYEVHHVGNIGSTYCFKVPYPQLDRRVLTYCRETAVQRDIADLIDRQNERLQKSAERAYQSDMSDRTKYVADMSAFAVNEDLLHTGYQSSHFITKG